MTKVLRKDKLTNKKDHNEFRNKNKLNITICKVAYSERGSSEKQFRTTVWESESLKSQHNYHVTNSLISKTSSRSHSKRMGGLTNIMDVMCSALRLASSAQLTVSVIIGVPVIIIIL